jgi:CheY-like chemotaxis protein
MIIHKCVLLVQTDDETVRATGEAFGALREACLVHVVSTAGEAISYLMGIGKYAERQEFPLPSLVLLGLRAGASDDFAVVDWIRSQRALEPLRIVVLAEDQDDESARRAYEAGVNSFLSRPGEFTALRELLRVLAKYWMECNQVPRSQRIHRPSV